MSAVAAARARRLQQDVKEEKYLAIIRSIDNWIFNGAQSDTKQSAAEYIRLLEQIPFIQPPSVRFAQGDRIMEAHDATILQKQSKYLNEIYQQYRRGERDVLNTIERYQSILNRLSLDTSGANFRKRLNEMQNKMYSK